MSAKQRIDFPAPRRAWPEVLEPLREVDPSTELLYYGPGIPTDEQNNPVEGVRPQGRWILGSVQRPNQVVIEQARGILAEEDKYLYSGDLPSIRAAQAAMQGFRAVELYYEEDLWNGFVVLDWRARDHLFRKARRYMKGILVAKACGDWKKERSLSHMLDAVQAEYKSIHAHAFRNRVVATVGGSSSSPFVAPSLN